MPKFRKIGNSRGELIKIKGEKYKFQSFEFREGLTLKVSQFWLGNVGMFDWGWQWVGRNSQGKSKIRKVVGNSSRKNLASETCEEGEMESTVTVEQ